MSHQRSKLLFLGRRVTASVIVLLLLALMASAIGAHPAVGGVIAAPAPAPRSAPLSPPAGDLDPTFGSGGLVMATMGSGRSYAHGVAIQDDGKTVAVGYVEIGNYYDDFALARYNSDGTLDTTFGSGGMVTTDFERGPDYAHAVVIQSDGKIVAAGYASKSDYVLDFDFALARYNSDGALDTTFGNGGLVTTDFGYWLDTAYAMAIQSDGKFMVAGYTKVDGNYYDDFALARYNDDGTLDTSFGSGGQVTTDFEGYNDQAYAVTIQSNGKIVVAGYKMVGNNFDHDFALARYNSNGSLDTSFANGGKVKTSFGSGSDSAHAVVFQSDGKIVAAGSTGIGGINDFALARYQVASTRSQTIAGGASATLEGVAITNRSGIPCDVTVTRHPIPPGGAPADLGEIPVLWQLATTCPSYTFDLAFSYTDTELLFGNNVAEADLQAYRAPAMNGPYSPVAGAVDTAANTVTVTGVTHLSWWGLSSNAPSAVTLAGFSALQQDGAAPISERLPGWPAVLATALALMAPPAIPCLRSRSPR